MMPHTHDTASPLGSEADPSEPIGAKVLVVDDSPTILFYTSEVLSAAGYEVRTCDTIWISSEVASFQPDLLLLDVDMGSCKGTSVVGALLDRSFAAQVVMVLYSTLNGADLRALAAECGAHGFIHKTDDPEALRRQVRRFLFSGVPDRSTPIGR